jgi:hypothetical protein
VTFSIVTEKHEVWRLAIGGAKPEADQVPKNLGATKAPQVAAQEEVRHAEPLLLAGYEGMKQREKTIPPRSQVRLSEALDPLIELSTAMNKPDEVKKWQAERAKYPEVTSRSPKQK